MKRHRIAWRTGIGVPVTHCGLWGWWYRTVERWYDVTCLNCLKDTGRKRCG